MANTEDIRQAYEEAEQKHRTAYRRAIWLEHRLFSAPTEEEYNAISAELEKQETELRTLAREATLARLCYTRACMMS